LPEFGGIVVGQIGSQEIAALAAPDRSELVAIERICHRSGLVVDLDLDETPSRRRLGARRAELHQPLLARHVHGGEFLQSRPQPFELPPAHRAFLADAVGALGEDIKFVVLSKQLDLDAFTRLAPRLVDKMFLETSEATFGCSHQIVRRRIAGAHLGENLLGRNAAIHHPHAPRLAVLALDLGEERAQRLAVGGVAGQDLISQRQALGRYHERDDELRAIGPLVAAVAMAALAFLRQIGGVDFEIGAGQIVEQHVEGGVEQIAPALGQMREQILFVSDKQVVTGIELVRLGEAEVGTQEIRHGAVEEPLAMQPPLASRRNEPVGDQHLQHQVPARPLAAFRQPFSPEAIELKLAPQDAGKPAGAPLARPTEPHLRQP